jgi:hypothetical protein
MYEPLSALGHFLRPHCSEICVGITAVTLMLVGPPARKLFLTLIRKFHWIVRYLMVIVLITAGFGTLSNLVYLASKRMLLAGDNTQFFLLTVGIYLVLGLIAKRERRV